MSEKGFTSHALMGAVFLGGVWFAVYLPSLIPAARSGDWPTWLILTVYFLGVTAGPALLIAIEGDEILGGLGIITALGVGWISARIAGMTGTSPGVVESIRICGAAAGPMLLYGGFHLLFLCRRSRKGC